MCFVYDGKQDTKKVSQSVDQSPISVFIQSLGEGPHRREVQPLSSHLSMGQGGATTGKMLTGKKQSSPGVEKR